MTTVSFAVKRCIALIDTIAQRNFFLCVRDKNVLSHRVCNRGYYHLIDRELLLLRYRTKRLRRNSEAFFVRKRKYENSGETNVLNQSSRFLSTKISHKR